MNILHITPDFNYACGRSYYVFLLLKYLKRAGCNVILLTDCGDSFARLKDNNIDLVIRRTLHFKTLPAIKKNIDFIQKLIDERKTDIVHTHHRMSEFIALRAIKKFKNGNVLSVITVLSNVRKRYHIEYKSDYVIAVSHNIKNMLTARFHVPERKIKIIPNFIDTEELTKLKSTRATDGKDDFRILTVCRFHRDKNIHLLLEALTQLNDTRIKLTLIGEGEQEKSLKEYIQKYNLNAEILPPQKNLSEHFLRTDICILTSDIDPFPTFMLQSGLYKKAFIGSDIPGINELIVNGKNGLLFSKGNLSELIEKILFLKNDTNLRIKLAENLHNDIMRSYTQQVCIPEIMKVYQSAAE